MSQPPKISPTELFEGQPASGQRPGLRGLLPSLLVNAAAPFVAYQVLTGNGVEPTQALQTSAVFPIVGIARGYVLPIPQFLLVSPILAIGVTVTLISWTMAYARRKARTGTERLAAMSSGS